jgi:predicted nucleic acid-binding protein
MKILFDTSVIVPAIVEEHPRHRRAFSFLKGAKSGEFEMLVASHTLAELYAVLTTLSVRERITPDMSKRLIQNSIEPFARVISLSHSDYIFVIRNMAELGIPGGAIYDALIARAAQKGRADKILTLNPQDFRRVWPEGASLIEEP